MFEYVQSTLPEINKPLSAKYQKSFAYPTFKERAPKILLSVICNLSKLEAEIVKKCGQESKDEIQTVISKIQKLKDNMQNDKPMEMIHANGKIINETNVYNNMFKERQEKNNCKAPSWFQTDWLFAECYMYFKLYEIFYVSKSLNTYDPFCTVKYDSLMNSKDPILKLSENLVALKNKEKLSEAELKDNFIYFVKCSLWGNKADLSLSGGTAVTVSEDVGGQMKLFDKHILVNELEGAYELLVNNKGENIIDIVLDNAGYELFNDLCLADFLLWSGLVKKIYFHGKTIPWFVSDVTFKDFHEILQLLSTDMFSSLTNGLAKDWAKYSENKKWTIECEPFWTLPYDYSKMQSTDPELYGELSNRNLVIFKGDLNYRKLVGDIYWEATTTFKQALRGFEPTNILAVRTIKADTVCGLPKGIFEELNSKVPDWMISGNYALLQFLRKE